jgi:hypothetical protein
MRAPKPAAFSFHPSLFVPLADAGLAVERIKSHVRTEQHPPIGLSPVAPKQDSLNRRFEVIVPDLVERHPTQLGKCVLMAVEERFLALSAKGFVHGTTTV